MIVNNLTIASQLYLKEVQSTHSGSSLYVMMQRGLHIDHTMSTNIENLMKNFMICIIPVTLEGQSCRQKLQSPLLCT